MFSFAAVTLQFVSHSFLDYHDPTIGKAFAWWSIQEIYVSFVTEDSYQQQALIDGEPALLDILDTAGQVEFTAMRDQYMRCGEGFIICYSICDRHSFQEASEYRKLIARVRLTEDIPLVLVANKLDLQSQRKVSLEEGKALAMQFGCPFYETSAALRCNVDEVFYTLVREIRRKEAQKVRQMAWMFTTFNNVFVCCPFRLIIITTRAQSRFDHQVAKSGVNGFVCAPSLLSSLRGKEAIDFIRWCSL